MDREDELTTFVDLERHPSSFIWGNMTDEAASDFMEGLRSEVDKDGLDIYILDG